MATLSNGNVCHVHDKSRGALDFLSEIELSHANQVANLKFQDFMVLSCMP